jgi:hypothetical protein
MSCKFLLTFVSDNCLLICLCVAYTTPMVADCIVITVVPTALLAIHLQFDNSANALVLRAV